jgi:UPF0271 protein
VNSGPIDLNADLGEGGDGDAAILEVVTSASIACGFHAGDPVLMLHTCRAARAAGVRIGAHPSYLDRDGFGRRDMEVDPDELSASIAYQVGALEGLAGQARTSVAFVKAHGALYNRAARDPDVGRALIDGAGQRPLLVLAHSPLADLVLSSGRPVYREAFADRRYQADGALTPRSRPGAVLEDPEEVAAQAVAIATGVPIDTAEGGQLTVRCDSICLHGDSPGAVQAARSVRAALDREGVTLAAFV